MPRGRKSIASLTVVSMVGPQRPEPPEELTPAQAKEWRAIVASMPSAYFDAGSLPLLVAYVRHVDTANVIARLLRETDPEVDLPTYARLATMAASQSKSIGDLATKLRLAQSNRFDAKKRISAVSPAAKPWDKQPA
jgi:hypothetical protein